MVHEKYIKVGNKTYGPYYYESYREGGKIKKRYVKFPPKRGRRVKKKPIGSRKRSNKKNRGKKLGGHAFLYFAIAFVLIALSVLLYVAEPELISTINKFLFVAPTISLSPVSGSSGNANLTIWTNGTPSMLNLTFGSLHGKTSSDWNFYFNTNFTNSSGAVINQLNGNGNCQIRFNETGIYTAFENMTYNPGSFFWQYNRNFTNKGDLSFQTNCTSSFGTVPLVANFFVLNTPPFVPPLTTISFTVSEDNFSSSNFSQFVSEDDVNDVLIYTIENITSTKYSETSPAFYSWITINSSSGFIFSNATNDGQTDTFGLTIKVLDDGNNGVDRDGAIKPVDLIITPVNDAPVFVNLTNQSFNMSQLFEYIIVASDEEDNLPFDFNITFLSCNTAPWSDRGSVNCDLFDSSQYSVTDTEINLSFTPTKNDVGTYEINFTVTDIGFPNASLSKVVNFTVLNVNGPPYFTYICDNERATVEDADFSCYINATDVDEINNLTFVANESWFTFDGANNSITVDAGFLTDFNASVLVNITATDIAVGNWNINLSVIDTGSPQGLNSTVFSFFVDNVNDSVGLDNIADITAFTSNFYTIYVNATDNDLLIPDKTVYNESLTFFSDTSWVNVSAFGVIAGTNITTAVIEFDPNDGGAGSHVVNISVRDANNYSIASDVFTITVEGNTPPIWDPAAKTEFVLIENVNFYLNLSTNVTDLESQPITFSHTNDTDFPSFSIDPVTGVINFTPIDEDVGQHFVNISVSDGVTPSYLMFNFTVYNINEVPFIETPLLVINASLDVVSNEINTTEDNITSMSFFVQDNDFRILSGQKNFYEENLTLNLTIVGPNTALFGFTKDSAFPTPSGPNANRSLFTTIFTPSKSDVGFYNITLNITDASNLSAVLEFPLNVLEIGHNPILMNLTNQTTTFGINFVYDINATDTEDGDDSSGNLNFSYDFLLDGKTDDFINGNEDIFNSTSGVLNMTFSALHNGSYHLNITVTDLAGSKDSDDFWLFVIDSPTILSPAQSTVFDLVEGVNSNLAFIANSSAPGNLTYQFFVNNVLKYNVSFYGNGSQINWQFTPNFTDETYGLFSNLTLTVLIPGFENLNFSRTWDANISHGNAPMVFVNDIGDKQAVAGSSININLTENFYDVDYLDSYYNQSANFSLASYSLPSGISYSVSSDWILSLSASSSLVELVNISGSDLDVDNNSLTSSVSNDFTVEFLNPSTPPPPSSSSTRHVPVLLKIIFPAPVSAFRGDIIELPISLVNEGTITLNDITLTSSVAKDGILREDLVSYFDIDSFDRLSGGENESVVLTVETSSEEIGLYEITINATAGSPRFSDWGKLYISVEESDSIVERILFTEELIADNPECAELEELIEESREYLIIGDFEQAEIKLTETVNACRESISQESLFSTKRFRDKLQDKAFFYLLITTVVAMGLGVAYYVYRTVMLKKRLSET